MGNRSTEFGVDNSSFLLLEHGHATQTNRQMQLNTLSHASAAIQLVWNNDNLRLNTYYVTDFTNRAFVSAR